MKKLIFLSFLIVTLSSCKYINEENIYNNENISIDSFLEESNNNPNENNMESIDKVEYKLDEIMWTNNKKEINENDINELIDLLFE